MANVSKQPKLKDFSNTVTEYECFMQFCHKNQKLMQT